MIKATRHNKRWTPDEDALLCNQYKTMTVDQMADAVGRTGRSTRARLERLALPLYSLDRNKAKPKVVRRKYEGWHVTNGIKFISVEGRGSVAEHRYLMEQKIGRRLLSKEQVHHINCDKTDNRIENLYLFENINKHATTHASVNKLIKPLMDANIILFNTDERVYELQPTTL